MEAPLPSLAPALRRDIRTPRPDYYRQMFDPLSCKVPRLCEGKKREYNNPIFGGFPSNNTHPAHHPPMMHYMGHFSRAMDLDIPDKTRLPIYKVGPQDIVRQAGPPAPYPLHGPQPKTGDFMMAARQEHLYGRVRSGLPLLPPPTLETESKCEACGSLANFMCSACKLVHYCSAACQVTPHILSDKSISNNLFLTERSLEPAWEIL